jgi:hypothetical protein
MDLQEESRRRVRASLFEWKQQTDGLFKEWILETVKTLALLNSAGLAGVAAIFASDGVAKAMLGNYPSAALFMVGLMAAGFDMYFNAQGWLGRNIEIFERIKRFDADELEARRAFEMTRKGERWFVAASIAGWTSAVMFVLGAWPFIRTAFGQVAHLMRQIGSACGRVVYTVYPHSIRGGHEHCSGPTT